MRLPATQGLPKWIFGFTVALPIIVINLHLIVISDLYFALAC